MMKVVDGGLFIDSLKALFSFSFPRAFQKGNFSQISQKVSLIKKSFVDKLRSFDIENE